jgi:glycosyltransferase involved in cell wall biosynthesis
MAGPKSSALRPPGASISPDSLRHAGALFRLRRLRLTSREDPFPTVALEALSVGVPVVAFEDPAAFPASW